MKHSWAVSCAVPGHSGRTGEDASGTHPSGDAVVVADGLSTAERAAEASQLAVSLILGPVREATLAGLSPAALPRFVHRLWMEQTSGDRALASTCIFASRTAHFLIAGQVGDGLCLILPPDGEPTRLPNGRGEYGNQTDCLPHSAPHCAVFSPDSAVLLATDGVADDLVPEQEGALLEALIARRQAIGIAGLQEELQGWLKNWKTQNSNDDRAIAVLALETSP